MLNFVGNNTGQDGLFGSIMDDASGKESCSRKVNNRES
jgi:hypothetical protein